MKKLLPLLAAAAIFAGGCMQEINMGELEDPVPESSVTSEMTGISETELTDIAKENIPGTSAGETAADIPIYEEDEPLPAIAENSCEHFFMLFDGADLSDGYIGDSMKEVLDCIPDDITVRKLKRSNIENAYSSGSTDRTLFAFTMNRCDGIIPVRSGGKTYYASGFTASDGEDYTIVFGDDEFSSPEEAAHYISACGRVDYLAVCADTGGGMVMMPIAAGNSRDGVYAVLPNAKIMGYDMSGVMPYDGMSDSVNIRIKKAELDEDSASLRLYYESDNSFSRNVCFKCDEIFVNGNAISTGNTFPIILYDSGTITLDRSEYSESDIFYFKGTIFAVDTSEEICSVGVTSYNASG